MKRRTERAAVAATSAILGVAFAASATAHAILMASVPAIGGTAAAGQIGISLRYNSLIDVKRSRVVLTDAAGRQTVLKLVPTALGDGMTANAVATVGPNTLRWQVLAVDGHITRGDIPFEAGGTGASGLPHGPVAGR